MNQSPESTKSVSVRALAQQFTTKTNAPENGAMERRATVVSHHHSPSRSPCGSPAEKESGLDEILKRRKQASENASNSSFHNSPDCSPQSPAPASPTLISASALPRLPVPPRKATFISSQRTSSPISRGVPIKPISPSPVPLSSTTATAPSSPPPSSQPIITATNQNKIFPPPLLPPDDQQPTAAAAAPLSPTPTQGIPSQPKGGQIAERIRALQSSVAQSSVAVSAKGIQIADKIRAATVRTTPSGNNTPIPPTGGPGKHHNKHHHPHAFRPRSPEPPPITESKTHFFGQDLTCVCLFVTGDGTVVHHTAELKRLTTLIDTLGVSTTSTPNITTADSTAQRMRNRNFSVHFRHEDSNGAETGGAGVGSPFLDQSNARKKLKQQDEEPECQPPGVSQNSNSENGQQQQQQQGGVLISDRIKALQSGLFSNLASVTASLSTITAAQAHFTGGDSSEISKTPQQSEHETPQTPTPTPRDWAALRTSLSTALSVNYFARYNFVRPGEGLMDYFDDLLGTDHPADSDFPAVQLKWQMASELMTSYQKRKELEREVGFAKNRAQRMHDEIERNPFKETLFQEKAKRQKLGESLSRTRDSVLKLRAALRDAKCQLDEEKAALEREKERIESNSQTDFGERLESLQRRRNFIVLDSRSHVELESKDFSLLTQDLQKRRAKIVTEISRIFKVQNSATNIPNPITEKKKRAPARFRTLAPSFDMVHSVALSANILERSSGVIRTRRAQTVFSLRQSSAAVGAELSISAVRDRSASSGVSEFPSGVGIGIGVGVGGQHFLGIEGAADGGGGSDEEENEDLEIWEDAFVNPLWHWEKFATNMTTPLQDSTPLPSTYSTHTAPQPDFSTLNSSDCPEISNNNPIPESGGSFGFGVSGLISCWVEEVWNKGSGVSILGYSLPPLQSAGTAATDEGIAIVLGYVCHAVQCLAGAFSIVLPHRLIPRGSRSLILTPSFSELPLYLSWDIDKRNFLLALVCLARNINYLVDKLLPMSRHFATSMQKYNTNVGSNSRDTSFSLSAMIASPAPIALQAHLQQMQPQDSPLAVLKLFLDTFPFMYS